MIENIGLSSMLEILKKIGLNNWISLAAFALATVVFFKNCSQDKKIDKLTYVSNAMQFRPLLQVLDKPRIYSYEIRTDKVNVPNFSTTQVNTDSIHDINATLRIYAKLRVANTGNAIANVYELIWTDTSSGGSEIREVLLNQKLREQKFVSSPDTDYFGIKDIKPGDTCDFQISHDVKYVYDQKFTMHFLLLYRNEAGDLFDTYYWARFKTIPFVWKTEFAIIDGQLAYRIGVDKKQVKEFITLYDQNTSWRLYSKSDAENILSFFEHLSKKRAH